MISGGLRTKGIKKQSKKNMPLITVVTAVRNGEKTLEETILSVINQTYANVEYIVIDGASADGTLDIIRKYEDKIDYWMSEPDKGIYDAMNKGIALSCGDYIALLNSDDWYELNACELIVNKINEVNADVYYAMMRVLNEKKEVLFIYGYTDRVLYRYMIAHPTCFIKKEIYKLYQYDTKYKSSADYDFIIRLKKNNSNFVFIEHIIANFRSGGISYSISAQIETSKILRKYRLINIFAYIIRRLFLYINYLINIYRNDI